MDFLGVMSDWIVNEIEGFECGGIKGLNPAIHGCGTGMKQVDQWKTKKSGLKVVTLIATLNPVSQVLW
jgi:hypothetical protein